MLVVQKVVGELPQLSCSSSRTEPTVVDAFATQQGKATVAVPQVRIPERMRGADRALCQCHWSWPIVRVPHERIPERTVEDIVVAARQWKR